MANIVRVGFLGDSIDTFIDIRLYSNHYTTNKLSLT